MSKKHQKDLLRKERKEAFDHRENKLQPAAAYLSPPHDAKKTFLCVLSIFVLGCVVYGNTLHSAFIWDDEILIQDNPVIKTPANIKSVFVKKPTNAAARGFAFYRPIQELSYMMDYSFWKLDVRGYHVTNILLHAAVALAVFWLTFLLSMDRTISLLTSLLFVAHPVHTEAVAYISGRADSLAALFLLLSLIFYIKHLSLKSVSSFAIMTACYIAALLSRENSLVLPFLLLLYSVAGFGKKSGPSTQTPARTGGLDRKSFATLSAVTVLFVSVRLTVLKFLITHPADSATVFQRAPGFFVALARYVKLLFFPFPLRMEYGRDLYGLGNPGAIAGILIFSSLLIFAWRRKEADRWMFYSIGWFFVTLAPQANIYPLNAYMAEHWLYVPSLGFFWILARGLTFLYRRKRPSRFWAAAPAALLLIFYSLATLRQNAYWKDPVLFYELTLRYAPHTSKVRNNLATLYYKQGKKAEAMALYERAIEIDPLYTEAYNNLGNIYREMGRNKEAAGLFEKALEIDPGYVQARANLGPAYYALGRKEEAIRVLREAIAADPGYAAAYNNLAGIYYFEKEYDEAFAYGEKARELGLAHSRILELLEPLMKKRDARPAGETDRQDRVLETQEKAF